MAEAAIYGWGHGDTYTKDMLHQLMESKRLIT